MAKKKSTNNVNNADSARLRNYATVVYADSAPSNWKEILADELIPCFISPYHDSDLNPTGEPKKPHWHVMLMFEGVKSERQVKEIFDKINGVGIYRVPSIRGMARYFCHLDNPDKHLYKTEDVIALAGADYIGTIGLAVDKYKAIGEMITFIKKHKIIHYTDILDYSYQHRFDWFRILCDCGSYVVSSYLKSNADRIRDEEIAYERTFIEDSIRSNS